MSGLHESVKKINEMRFCHLANILFSLYCVKYSTDCVKCNNVFQRVEFHAIKARLEEPRKFIQVVMGARQIGKSTVVKQVLQTMDAPYQFFSADNVPATNSGWISNCWAATRSLKETNGWEIDEAQERV